MFPNVNETQTFINTVTITPILSVHANYIANDYVGTSSTAAVIANAARVPGGRGIIKSVVFIDEGLQSIAGELWVFTSAVTPPLDSAAWTISDADAVTCVGVFPFATYYASALNSISISSGSEVGFKCANGSTSLYACFVTRGAPSYASGEINFTLTFIQD